MIKSFASVLIALSFVVAACSDTVDPVTNHFDCGDVCERWRDCVDSDYDVDSCRNKCEDDASDSNEKQTKLDNCAECLKNNDSCLKEGVSCASSCSAFVP